MSGTTEELFCSAGECLDAAVVHGWATLRVGPLTSAPPEEERQTFSLPLCRHHARLLGEGATLVKFSNGLLENRRARRSEPDSR